MSELIVAKTIFEQLGGTGRLKVMIGAKNFAGDEDSAMFRFTCRGQKKINYIKIRLNGLDLYDVEFGRIGIVNRVHGYRIIETIENVYCEDLKRIIEDTIGLALSL